MTLCRYISIEQLKSSYHGIEVIFGRDEYSSIDRQTGGDTDFSVGNNRLLACNSKRSFDNYSNQASWLIEFLPFDLISAKTSSSWRKPNLSAALSLIVSAVALTGWRSVQ